MYQFSVLNNTYTKNTISVEGLNKRTIFSGQNIKLAQAAHNYKYLYYFKKGFLKFNFNHSVAHKSNFCLNPARLCGFHNGTQEAPGQHQCTGLQATHSSREAGCKFCCSR